MCRLKLTAVGMVATRKSNFLPISVAIKATDLLSLSSLATSNVAPVRFAKAIAAVNWGLSALRPLSTSQKRSKTS